MGITYYVSIIHVSFFILSKHGSADKAHYNFTTLSLGNVICIIRSPRLPGTLFYIPQRYGSMACLGLLFWHGNRDNGIYGTSASWHPVMLFMMPIFTLEIFIQSATKNPANIITGHRPLLEWNGNSRFLFIFITIFVRRQWQLIIIRKELILT